MLQMIVLVAHEKLSDPVGQNRSRSANRIIQFLEERVLAHSSNVHHAVDDDHWNQPDIQDHLPRCHADGDSKQSEQQQDLGGDPASIRVCPLSKSQNWNHYDVDRIADNQT